AIDYSKLDRLLPILNVQPVAHREWLEKAKKLSRKELEMEIRASKGKMQQESTGEKFTYSYDPSLPDEWIDTIQYGDCLSLLKLFPDDSIDFCMTSPPSWGDRDTVPGQLGSEPTWQGYVEKSLEIYRELRRVLKEEGSLYLNLRDSYSPAVWLLSGRATHKDIPPESLIGIHWRVALAMIDEGWILRNAIVWHKTNAMPYSERNRLSNTYETLFHFVKSQQYYYALDAIVVNPGDFWEIDAQPSTEAHLDDYPEGLCVTPIKSSCPEDGIVLDIFAGIGTTLLAAKKLGRKYLGFETNPDYIEIANKRILDCEERKDNYSSI
ncbi:site-specific DNA-methyltransferase, partial [Candidatus Dojkabacteria bacterium]|nr:site-specific DNA-methyltransferase [Candidatus Dojkabacteria bacterium]